MRKIKYTIISALLALPFVSSATGTAPAGLTSPTKPTGLPGDSGDTISTTVGYYINVFLGIVGIVAVAFLIYGGFLYITSGGNEEQAESGKKVIQNSIIGIIIIILSYAIVTVIINAFKNGTA